MPLKPLSKDLEERLAKAQAHPRALLRQVFGREAELDYEAFAISGETAAIPALLPFAFTSTLPGRAHAWKAISHLLSHVPAQEFAALDEAIRDTFRRMRVPGPLRGDWFRIIENEEDATAKLCILSAHSEGRVREKAVRKLAHQNVGFELAFLLVRLNDWVEPVRVLARVAVLLRVDPARSVHFVQYLPLVLQLRAPYRRTSHGDLVEAIFAMLALPLAQDAVSAGLASTDRAVVRACFETVARRGAQAPGPWRELAVASVDLLIRRRAIEHWMRSAPAGEVPDLWHRFRQDRSWNVQRAALLALIERRPELSIEPLQERLLDSRAAGASPLLGGR